MRGERGKKSSERAAWKKNKSKGWVIAREQSIIGQKKPIPNVGQATIYGGQHEVLRIPFGWI
jgi:hypothetical protein